jgi:hypothetical protein
MLLHLPERECAWKALHSHSIVLLPSQPFVLPGTEPTDVLFGTIAQPDLRIFYGSDYAGGEVHSAAKHIAFLHMNRPDVNAGTDLNLRMARIPLKCHRVVQCFACGLERRHEAVANGLDFPAIEPANQLAALGKVRPPHFIHDLVEFAGLDITMCHKNLNRHGTQWFNQ